MTIESLILSLSILALLLILSAIFSGSETAVTAASRARLHKRAQDGDKRAAKLQRLLEKRERLIGALLISNNLVNILASSIATALLFFFVGDSAVLYATLIMTFLIVVFAEIFPKTFALQRAERIASGLSPMLNLLLFVFGPIAQGLQRSAEFVLRVKTRRDDDPNAQQIAAQEEILGAIDLHHQQGAMVKSDRDMLGGVLDLKDTPISDVMRHVSKIRSLNCSISSDKLLKLAIKSPHSRIPCHEGDPNVIIGVLHARDLLKAVAEHGREFNDFRSILRKPWFVPETNTLETQLDGFRTRKQRFALVIDEYGALSGLITLEDILEEIVGDFHDEDDPHDEHLKPHPLPDGSVTLPGEALIRDVNRLMDWRLPDDDNAATLTGLVFAHAQEVPKPGSVFSIDDFLFKVLESSSTRVDKLNVTPPQSPRPENSAQATA